MATSSAPHPELVVTVALQTEIPRRWLDALGVRVHRLRALEAGAYRATAGPNSGVLIVITGVGRDSARRAAEWIRDRVAPTFVVNIGAAGGLAADTALGHWYRVGAVTNEAGETLEVDPRLPFAWPDALDQPTIRRLITVAQPLTTGGPTEDLVDMEAHAQASVFRDTETAFHALKFVSDRPSEETPAHFQAQLDRLQNEIKLILSFLEPRTSADIGVVIPVHDRPAEIARCLDSVLDQQLPPREIVVVDDGSSDETPQVVETYRFRGVTLLRLPHNVGVSAARNAGIARLTTTWVALLDSDDQWKPTMLSGMWTYWRAHPYYRALQSEEIWIREGVRVNRRKHHTKPRGWIWSPSLHRCLVSPSAVMLERSLLDELGGFDETLAVCEDYDLWIRLARWHPVGLDPTPSLVKYGGHADQLSRRYQAMDRFRVRALHKALADEDSSQRRAELGAVLSQKLKVLIGGARKRGLHAELDQYEDALALVELSNK